MSSGYAKWTLVAFAALSVATFANLLSQSDTGPRAGARPKTTLIATGPTASPTGSNDASGPTAAGASKGTAAASGELLEAISRELRFKGYDTGSGGSGADRSQIFSAAIMAYEYDHGLPLTGLPTENLFRTLVFGAPARRGSVTATERTQVGHATAEQVVRQAQHLLAKLGYSPGKGSAEYDRKLRRAITEFERDRGLAETGRISGPLMAVLTRQAQGRR